MHAPFDPVSPRLTVFGIIWHHLAPLVPDWPHLALLGHSSRYFKVPIRQGALLLMQNLYIFLLQSFFSPYGGTYLILNLYFLL